MKKPKAGQIVKISFKDGTVGFFGFTNGKFINLKTGRRLSWLKSLYMDYWEGISDRRVYTEYSVGEYY